LQQCENHLQKLESSKLVGTIIKQIGVLRLCIHEAWLHFFLLELLINNYY
jgi:hypothetical protein